MLRPFFSLRHGWFLSFYVFDKALILYLFDIFLTTYLFDIDSLQWRSLKLNLEGASLLNQPVRLMILSLNRVTSQHLSVSLLFQGQLATLSVLSVFFSSLRALLSSSQRQQGIIIVNYSILYTNLSGKGGHGPLWPQWGSATDSLYAPYHRNSTIVETYLHLKFACIWWSRSMCRGAGVCAIGDILRGRLVGKIFGETLL
jgi:hypothetical protein